MNKVNEASPAGETDDLERRVSSHTGFAIDIESLKRQCNEYLSDKDKIGKGIPLNPYVVRELLRRAGHDC